MASQDAFHGIFEVEVVRKTVVKAAGPVPESHVISLSNLDLLSGRFPVTYIYFYRRTHSSSLIGGSLKESLAQCLRHFYPFAGRISENPKSGEPEIICDNSGALVVEAQASISLDEFDFYNLNKSLQGKLISVNHQFPDHSRSLRARFPPTYDPSLDEEFVSCTMEEICNIPTISILLKRLYYIDESSINRLQRLASANGNKRTKIEAFSAYIWKVMANAIDKNHEFCKIGWLVDGRSRLSKCQNSMSNYIGNVLSLAFGESNVADLKKGSIAGIADIIHKAISTVTNEAHFRNLIDWVECHRPGLMISKNVLGLGGPALVISSGRRFPVAELDFGFGNPVLGTVSSTIEGLGVGYINQRQSAGADGSWTVSAILWPEMVEALESDPSK